MKRRDLLRMLRDAARAADMDLVLLRRTGGHEVLSFGGHRIVIPKHRRIAKGTAASILRQAAAAAAAATEDEEAEE